MVSWASCLVRPCGGLPSARDVRLRFGLTCRAFDLEKRQHLFANGIIPKLQPGQVGFYGSGIVTDLGIDIQKAEDELEAKWSSKGAKRSGDEPILELKGEGIGSAHAGRETVL